MDKLTFYMEDITTGEGFQSYILSELLEIMEKRFKEYDNMRIGNPPIFTIRVL